MRTIFSVLLALFILWVFSISEAPLSPHVLGLCSAMCFVGSSELSDVELDKVQSILPQISLDQLVVCAFYVICRVHGINISFHSILEVYTTYLQPYQSISNIVVWGDVNRLWFGIDLSFVEDANMSGNKTMIELYNAFFVPLVYPVIQHFQVVIQMKKDWNELFTVIAVFYELFVWYVVPEWTQ